MKGRKFFIGAVLVSLFFVGSANAGNVKIAFTVTVQEPSTPVTISGITVDQYSLTKLRATEKDILVLLGTLGYTIPTNGSLFWNGNFLRIIDGDGIVVDTVASDDLLLYDYGTTIQKGVWDFLLGDKNKMTYLFKSVFTMNIDPSNYFDLVGVAEETADQLPDHVSNRSFKANYAGDGKYQGKQCVVTGTVKFKVQTPIL